MVPLCEEGGLAGWSPTMCRGHHHCVVRSWYSMPTVLPNGWHRTTKANIRFHLVRRTAGVESSWLRTWTLHVRWLKAVGSCVVFVWSPRGPCPRVCGGFEPSHGRGVSFAFFRSGLEHLRASSRFERASAVHSRARRSE